MFFTCDRQRDAHSGGGGAIAAFGVRNGTTGLRGLRARADARTARATRHGRDGGRALGRQRASAQARQASEPRRAARAVRARKTTRAKALRASGPNERAARGRALASASAAACSHAHGSVVVGDACASVPSERRACSRAPRCWKHEAKAVARRSTSSSSPADRLVGRRRYAGFAALFLTLLV